MIDIQNVTVEYEDGIKALDDVSLSIEKGDFAFVIGSTGSGKSTLLKLLYKEINATKGKIFVDGENLADMKKGQIPFLRRKLGIVFQDYKLLPQKNLYENLAFVLRAVGTHPKEIREKIFDALDVVGLKERIDALPSQMSGGEQQRAAIARALINSPKVLIADEPTGNLDPDTSLEIMKLLYGINQVLGMTMIVATHDKALVNLVQRHVIQLDKGRIIRDEFNARYD
ncbi:MAG: cell division ATP-binding protein FtsE [Abditibacteriota bacterium]|nr:cell division ATP-binding protein FtsE [Abditibacteriota bacterium]